jgi:hypothetical protein
VKIALLAAFASLLALPLPADDPPACPAIDPPAAARLRVGLRAFRDPATGELRKPAPGEAAAAARAEAEAAPESTPVFEVVVHPDGMKTVDLQGAFTSAAVATRNPDGSITIRCLPAGAAPAPRPARSGPEEK